MTTVHSVSEPELEARRAQLLVALGLTDAELRARVAAGGLVGADWVRWAEIEEIDYLLGRD